MTFRPRGLDRMVDAVLMPPTTELDAEIPLTYADLFCGIGGSHSPAKNLLLKAVFATDIPNNPTVKDGRCTEGLALNKTNWAETIDTPPYYGWAVTTGISFTFGGVKINTRGQIVTNAQEPIPGLYAAGEMVGGLFYYNYPGGSGLSAGMVFGRLSGASAAEDAMKLKDV